MRTKILVLSIIFTICSFATENTEKIVTLTINEVFGIKRINEPVSSGIPFQYDMLKKEDRLILEDEQGQEVPAQFTVLSTHLNESVAWLLIDFLATLDANSKKSFILKKGISQTSSEIKTEENKEFIIIDNGVIKLEIKKIGFNLFNRVWIDENKNNKYEKNELIISQDKNSGIIITDQDGTIYSSQLGYPKEIEFEEIGSQKVVLKISGKTISATGNEHLDYTARIQVWQNSKIVKVLFTQENNKGLSNIPYNDDSWPAGNEFYGTGKYGGDPNSLLMEDLSIILKLNSKKTKSTFLLEDGKKITGQNMCVYQDSSGGENWNYPGSQGVSFKGYKYQENKEVGFGNRSLGIVDVSSKNLGMGIGIRYFWQNYPKAIEVSNNYVYINLMPKQFSQPFDHRPGEHKTHELLFYFHNGKDSENSVTTIQALNNPLKAWAPSSWYLGTRDIPSALPYSDELMQKYDKTLSILLNLTPSKHSHNFITMRELQDEYGWMDFGDVYASCEFVDKRRAYNSHSNLEYDGSYGFLFQTIRYVDTDPKIAYILWQLGEDAARHETDIDIFHSQTGACKAHWGGRYRHNEHDVDIFNSPHRGAMADYQHAWTRGMMLYYRLTGYKKCRDTAIGVADQILRRNLLTTSWFGFWGADMRTPGSQMNPVLEAYIETKEYIYEDYIKAVLRRLGQEEFGFPSGVPRNRPIIPWALFLYNETLIKYCNILKENGKKIPDYVLARIKDIADLLINYCWQEQTKDSPGGFYYSVDKTGKGNGIDTYYQGNISNFLIGAWKYLKDEKYLDFAKKSWEVMNHYIDNENHYLDNKSATQFIQGGYLYPYYYKKNLENK